MTMADEIVGLATTGQARGFAWLDGAGLERSFVGAWPDLEVVGDDLALLDGVEALWRSDPRYVWIGWLSYDVGANALLGRSSPRWSMPGVVWRRYPGALEMGEGSVVFHGDDAACRRLQAALSRARRTETGPAWPLGPLTARLAPERYRDRIRTAQAHIVAGETYQVNLSQPFFAPWREEALSWPLAERASRVFARLREETPAPLAALIDAGRAWFVSNSPETLLDVRLGAGPDGTDVASSHPIKGTRPRGTCPAEDRERARELEESIKDLAEHVMIVDLVRNDLGQVAVPGSVQAPARPSLVTLPTVHHLVSEIRCCLRPGWSLMELIRALFPAGSITGAPKRRTVEVIDALEGAPRGIYCGAIGVLEPGGLKLSIPIRTGVLDQAGLSLASGGGIVADSEPEAERLETIVKTRAFEGR